MSLELSLEEIIEILGGRLAVGMMSDQIGAVASDTRCGVEGCWFLCLNGERFDGHDFLGEAFSGGALGCIVNERTGYPIASTGFPLVAVPDTGEALTRLARNWRRRLGYKVIFLVDDDRERSGNLAESLFSYFQRSGKTEIFDLRFDRGSDCLEKMLSFGPDLKYLLINFLPTDLESAKRLLFAFGPDRVLSIGEMFRYFRITASSTDIDALCGALLKELHERDGVLLADKAPQESPLTDDLKLIVRSEREDSESEPDEEMLSRWLIEKLQECS